MIVDTLRITWNRLEHWVVEKYEMIYEVESREYNLINKDMECL